MVLHRRAMLKRIYDWCIDAAHKPYALWIMGAVAFAESSFFPVPPDVMLIPMSLARPQRAWLYAAVCTATSVVGGLLGYAIGALLFDSVGHWLIQVYGLGDKVEAFRASYAEWGAVIILLNRYGDWIRVRIEKHLGLWVAIGAAVLVLGFVVAIKLI